MKRQNIRKAVQLVSLLAFPATIYYMSPAIPLMAAANGIVAGSLLFFLLLFVSAPLLGRLFCSWVCPAGAIGDLTTAVRPARVNRGRIHWIKYLIWVPWVGGLVMLLLRAGGVHSVQIDYATDHGLSVTDFHALVIYLIVVAVFLVLGLAVGKRAGCHTICWMAPFMIAGRFVGRRLGIPGIELRARSEACTACGTCTSGCPMSLPVSSMVAAGRMQHSDCSLCGSCVDRCPRKVIGFAWGNSDNGAKGKRGKLLRSATVALGVLITGGFVAAGSGCSLGSGVHMVPPTVTEDPSLPSAAIVVDGKERHIHVREFGDASNPLLMVAPGSLSDVTPYLAFETFADAYHVVLWDLRGNGLSERVPSSELSPSLMAEELHAVKQLYSSDAPATVVGHSWSADFAAIYLGRYPEEVSQAILLEPTGLTSADMESVPNVVNLFSTGYLDKAWIADIMSPSSHEALDFRMYAMLSSAVRDYFVDRDHPPPWPVSGPF